MSHIVWFAGLLGLIALAFGKRSAVAVAQAIVLLAVVLVGLLVEEKLSHGLLINYLIPSNPVCRPYPACLRNTR
jgi:hypothetical protein